MLAAAAPAVGDWRSAPPAAWAALHRRFEGPRAPVWRPRALATPGASAPQAAPDPAPAATAPSSTPVGVEDVEVPEAAPDAAHVAAELSAARVEDAEARALATPGASAPQARRDPAPAAAAPSAAPVGVEDVEVPDFETVDKVGGAEAASGSTRGLLTVFGASGNTGLVLVLMALDQGYRVRAFVRNIHAFSRELGDSFRHPALEVVCADLCDAVAVENAVAGVSAVISVAGAKPETAPGPMASAMPAIVEGCRRHGVRRLIIQACALDAAPTERVGWLTQGSLVRTIVRWQLGSTIVDDNEAVLRFIKDVTDVQWTVSRPGSLVDGDALGGLAPCMDPFRTGTVRYADVAEWTLAQVDSDAYIFKMPRLYYAPIQHPI